MIELRRAVFADYPAIAALHADSWRQHYRGIFSDHWLDTEVENNRSAVWRERLSKPAGNQHVTIAFTGETATGFACLFLDHDPVFGSLLDNLHVTKNFQRAGIGRQLMRDCAAFIFEKSSKNNMYLWVFESNANARAAYEKSGGHQFETVKIQNEDGTQAQACRYTWDSAALQALIR